MNIPWGTVGKWLLKVVGDAAAKQIAKGMTEKSK